MTIPARPWSVPVAIHDIPEAGRRFELVADEATRAAMATAAGVNGVPRLVASFDVTQHGKDGLQVVGTISATVTQTCVVTLEPVENTIEEVADLLFVPDDGKQSAPEAQEMGEEADDGPEPLVNGTVDLGAMAVEFLILAVDPYPRKSGVVFEPTTAGDAEAAHPFAALAALKKKQAGKDG